MEVLRADLADVLDALVDNFLLVVRCAGEVGVEGKRARCGNANRQSRRSRDVLELQDQLIAWRHGRVAIGKHRSASLDKERSRRQWEEIKDVVVVAAEDVSAFNRRQHARAVGRCAGIKNRIDVDTTATCELFGTCCAWLCIGSRDRRVINVDCDLARDGARRQAIDLEAAAVTAHRTDSSRHGADQHQLVAGVIRRIQPLADGIKGQAAQVLARRADDDRRARRRIDRQQLVRGVIDREQLTVCAIERHAIDVGDRRSRRRDRNNTQSRRHASRCVDGNKRVNVVCKGKQRRAAAMSRCRIVVARGGSDIKRLRADSGRRIDREQVTVVAGDLVQPEHGRRGRVDSQG